MHYAAFKLFTKFLVFVQHVWRPPHAQRFHGQLAAHKQDAGKRIPDKRREVEPWLKASLLRRFNLRQNLGLKQVCCSVLVNVFWFPQNQSVLFLRSTFLKFM